jgi:hypothetical protein
MAKGNRSSPRKTSKWVPYHQVSQIRRRETEAEHCRANAAEARKLAPARRAAAAETKAPEEREALLRLADEHVGYEEHAARIAPTEEQLAGADDLRRKVNELCGFDLDDAQERLLDWLCKQGFHRRSLEGHSLGGAEPTSATADERRRAAGVRAAIRTIIHYKTMHGVERAAAQRWYDEVQRLRRALDRFRACADVRVQELSFFSSRATRSASRIHGTAMRARSLIQSAGALRRRVSDAIARIIRYENDPLTPVDATGRKRDGVLKQVEFSLYHAGFKPHEIARLVIDTQRRKAPHGAQARKRHGNRIRRRVERYAADKRAFDQAVAKAAAKLGLDPLDESA